MVGAIGRQWCIPWRTKRYIYSTHVVGMANNLEEGVAVAFSLHVQHLYGVNIQVPSMPSYVYAFKLVNSLSGGAIESARRIRRELGPFSNVTPKDLVTLFPCVDAKLANNLTLKFNRDAVPSNLGTS